MKPTAEGSLCSALERIQPATRTIRTFLAEDSPFLMAVLARILSKDGRVRLVGSATDGRSAARDALELQPDLLITDLQMPGMYGTEVVALLKQLPDPPIVIVVTGEEGPEARARSMAAGADAFIVKTVDLGQRLLAAIRELFPGNDERIESEWRHRRESVTSVL